MPRPVQGDTQGDVSFKGRAPPTIDRYRSSAIAGRIPGVVRHRRQVVRTRDDFPACPDSGGKWRVYFRGLDDRCDVLDRMAKPAITRFRCRINSAVTLCIAPGTPVRGVRTRILWNGARVTAIRPLNSGGRDSSVAPSRSTPLLMV